MSVENNLIKKKRKKKNLNKQWVYKVDKVDFKMYTTESLKKRTKEMEFVKIKFKNLKNSSYVEMTFTQKQSYRQH